MTSISSNKPLRVKPNPHPYAIKTTSTGILSGSHSASASVSPSPQSPHHYIPSSPSPSPTKPTHSHRHRYSRSLTSDTPLPIPLHNRSTTNPNQWNSDQLVAHLTSTLHSEDLPIAEITTFIKHLEINAMTFMRFDDEVLNAYGVDAKWRPALLSASRSLRQDVLNMGLPNSVSTNSNSNPNPNFNPRVSRSANSSPTRPRHSTTSDDLFVSYDYHNDDQEDGYLSSSSRSSISSYSSSILSTTSSHDEHSIGNRNENENENENVTRRRTRHNTNSNRHSRVRGMVASFERSNSLSSSTPNHPNPLAGTYNALPPTTIKGHPNGRPLPQTPSSSHLVYAHTGTGGTASTPNLNGRLSVQHTGLSQRPLPVPPNEGYVPFPSLVPLGGGGEVKEKEKSMQDLLDMSSQEDNASPGLGGSTTTTTTENVSLPPVPVPAPTPDTQPTKEDEEDEPTIAELLSLTHDDDGDDSGGGQHTHTGADAWELDFGVRETVKRVVPLDVVGSAGGSGRIGRSLGRRCCTSSEGGYQRLRGELGSWRGGCWGGRQTGRARARAKGKGKGRVGLCLCYGM
ncbi:hypothetical protein L208DRAFT_472350 [Tricholoma matsutake]|nr:hypothetical protein L208DRAFT_472350 [Tricholoma matsutake 945]